MLNNSEELPAGRKREPVLSKPPQRIVRLSCACDATLAARAMLLHGAVIRIMSVVSMRHVPYSHVLDVSHLTDFVC